jgi:hypothetical protein
VRHSGFQCPSPFPPHQLCVLLILHYVLFSLAQYFVQLHCLLLDSVAWLRAPFHLSEVTGPLSTFPSLDSPRNGDQSFLARLLDEQLPPKTVATANIRSVASPFKKIAVRRALGRFHKSNSEYLAVGRKLPNSADGLDAVQCRKANVKELFGTCRTACRPSEEECSVYLR